MINTLKKRASLTVNKHQTPLLFKGSRTVARLHTVLKYTTIQELHVHTHLYLCVKKINLVGAHKGHEQCD